MAGPYAGTMLADMGADVVKIEAPGGGDYSRGLGPFAPGSPDGAGFLRLDAPKVDGRQHVRGDRQRLETEEQDDEVVRAGEAYHLRPGHFVQTIEPVELLELSPVAEHDRTMTTLARNMGLVVAS